MSRLRMLQVLMATVILSAELAFVPTMAAGTTQTLTGKVSDAMCGAKHTEGLAPMSANLRNSGFIPLDSAATECYLWE